MAFTNLTGTTELDSSLVELFDQSFLIACGQNNVMDQFVQHKRDVGAVSIQLTKYARIPVNTTPLDEYAEGASAVLSDSAVIITPREYGNKVTKTNLASLQTGGKADLATAELIGINYGETMDTLAINALNATTNSYVVGGAAEADVTVGGVANQAFLNYFFNKLSRKSVPKINGLYVAAMHEDVIADLRNDTSAGGWVDVIKYSNPETALVNEVGTYKGFRIVTDNLIAPADQGGAGTVDIYDSYFFGFNALGKGTSQAGSLKITGPFDDYARLVNVVWYEVSGYKIIDTDAIWKGRSASSVAPGNAI